MKTMAAVLRQVREPLSLEELDIPRLQRGQVLVDLAYSGVCHTQLLEAQGKRGVDQYLPHTLGHEGSGTVLDVGDGVRKVKPGDRVVLSWLRGEGLEAPSLGYSGAGGRVNSGLISTFMSTTVTSENRVTRIPTAMPLQQAALLGCAIPTGAGVVLNTARVRPGSSVAVFGVGGVGLSAVIGANLAHAAQIIAIDIDEGKLRQALAFGATHTVDARVPGLLETILNLTGGKGVDFAIEAAGRRETMEASFRSVRDRGGLCVLAGNLDYQEKIAIDPMDLIRGKRLVGTAGGESDPDRDIPMYADLYLKGKLPLDGLITHLHPLEDVNQALEDLGEKRANRVLLKIADDHIDLTSA